MNKFSIRSTFDLMYEQINLLVDDIKKSDVINSTFFELPKISKSDEHKAPKSIEVKKITGQKAIDKCCEAYLDMFLNNKQSGKVAQRYPGLLLINDNGEQIQKRLQAVNKAKLDFKNLILEIGNSDARFEAVHNAIPNLITLAAYRKIHSESDSPYSVRFTWMKKHATQTLSKEAAMQMLNRSSSYSNPRMIDQSKWLALVENEKYRLSSLKENSRLRIRRPTRVTPEVNIRYTAQNRYHVSAALPFILLNPNSEIKLGDLSNYNSETTDPRKRDYKYLVERIYLEQVD
ncbi:DNA replication terminus site-binding protein (plasmid) [Pseudoalteromonas sp. T1lg65]|uniref:DNA replication terminus site-binding protein n=1 Tax=Pseudoalteromonas sp. T1lg65 TaxID=2077101 RepID=UPI003F798008